MIIVYAFSTKDFAALGPETEVLMKQLQSQCVSVEPISVRDMDETPDGFPIVELKAVMTPEQINTALSRSGYEGNDVVGVNNDTRKVLFEDDINDMYIISSVFLEFKDGFIHAEPGQSKDQDSFGMFSGF